MNDTMRAILVIVGIILIFILSYVAAEHLSESYIIKENIELNILKAENDSLKIVVDKLQNVEVSSNE